ncbi:hypothetical protein KM043_004708 [Ampulex compressa]|nr:hypothetical protein KM043_004708 [Ampulex compressa]
MIVFIIEVFGQNSGNVLSSSSYRTVFEKKGENLSQEKILGSTGLNLRLSDTSKRPFFKRKTDILPYEQSTFGYQIEQNVDHSIGFTKHLVIVSFIGLLLLFAIIQNTMIVMRGRHSHALSSRRKREQNSLYDVHPETPEQAEIIDNDARLRCIQRTLCLENQKLVEDLGSVGEVLGKYLTHGVEESLRSFNGWDRLVADAGAAGIRGDNCERASFQFTDLWMQLCYWNC